MSGPFPEPSHRCAYHPPVSCPACPCCTILRRPVPNCLTSQVPGCVVEAVREHLTSHCAQLGAGYGRSHRSSQIVRNAHEWLEVFMNVRGLGQVSVTHHGVAGAWPTFRKR